MNEPIDLAADMLRYINPSYVLWTSYDRVSAIL